MNTHLMVDIETMSTRQDAAILSIGAVLFDPNGDSIDETRTFNQTIGIESNEAEGRHFSGATIAWWLKQSQEARKALLTDTLPLGTALTKFKTWIARNTPTLVWANSPSFDVAILKHAFAQQKMHWPFAYWAERDVRTLKDAAYPNGDAPAITHGTAHGALDDAIKQALLVQRCHYALRR